jgi:hypothetical protein
MLGLFKSDGRRKATREDRKFILRPARRFLTTYLASHGSKKQQFYEVIAGAAAACQPECFDLNLENTELCKEIAQKALSVVKARERRPTSDNGPLEQLITDAYATVALAYRRAAALYVLDEEMQQIGTAAVHMVTIANSYNHRHLDNSSLDNSQPDSGVCEAIHS